jgi:hypothetical protein
MTGLRLGDFQRAGLEATQGTLELLDQKGKQSLTNAGTRWQRFSASTAARFSNAAEKASSQQEAQGRQQAALDSFRSVLKDRFGAAVANEALRRAGLHGPGATSMTWQHGKRALDEARRLTAQNRQIHQGFCSDHLARGSDGGFSGPFRELCTRQGVDPGRLTARQISAYEHRFQEALLARAQGGQRRLSYDEARQIAAGALGDANRLGDDGLARAAERRRAFVQSIGEAVAQVANGADGARTVAALQQADAALRAWMRAEGVDINQDNLKDFRQRGMDEAIRRLDSRHPGTAQRALAKGLGDQGALRMVCTAALARIDGNGTAMAGLSGMARSLVAQLSLRAGPLGATHLDDMRRVADRQGLPAPRMAETGEALDTIASDEAALRRPERKALVEAIVGGPAERERALLHLATSGNGILAEELQVGARGAGHGARLEFLRELQSLQGLEDADRRGEAIQRFRAKWLDPAPEGQEPRVALSEAARQAARDALLADARDGQAFRRAQSEVLGALDHEFAAGFVDREHAAFSPAHDAALQAAELRRKLRDGEIGPDEVASRSGPIIARLLREPNLEAGAPLGTVALRSFCAAMADLTAARLEADARSEPRFRLGKMALQDIRGQIHAQRDAGAMQVAKALSIVSKAEAQIDAEVEMAQSDAFRGFPGAQAWRMVMDGHLQEARGEYGFENEQGYMAGMLGGLTLMLRDAREGRPLDATSYEQLHDTSVAAVYTKPTMDPQEPELGKLKEGYRTRVGNAGVGYPLKPVDPADPLRRGNITVAGRAELERRIADAGPDPWFFIDPRRREDALDKVWSNPRTAEQCRTRVNDIFVSYRVELARATSEDDRLRAIARCCQALDQSHVFEDGNIRTVAFLVMNRLLIDNGLSPAILREPNMFDGYALHEMVGEIRAGQAEFRRISGAAIA